jgi:hypothetical protein
MDSPVHWLSVFEPTAAQLWHVVFGALILCAVMVLALFLEGMRHGRLQRVLDDTERTWRPWFSRSHLGNEPIMRLPQASLPASYVAQMWLELLLRVDRGSRETWLTRARAAGVPDFVFDVLNRPRRHAPAELETAATLAGMLNLPQATKPLRRLMQHRAPAISFAASLALLRLAPEMTETVWTEAPSANWSRAALLTLLREVPSEQVDDFVQRRMAERPAKEAAQLLSAWAQLPGRGAAHYATKLLANPEAEGWLLCAALRIQDDVTQSPVLRQYLDHPRWAVRLLALRAIAKLGYGQDLAALEKFRDSDNWWVRVRAREALAEINGSTQ